MKSLIFQKTTRTSKIERTAIFLLGVCIFISERDIERDEDEKQRRRIGFVQFASVDASDDDDADEEDDE
jgi:hypothetical protein